MSGCESLRPSLLHSWPVAPVLKVDSFSCLGRQHITGRVKPGQAAIEERVGGSPWHKFQPAAVSIVNRAACIGCADCGNPANFNASAFSVTVMVLAAIASAAHSGLSSMPRLA